MRERGGAFLVIPVKRSIGAKQRLAGELPDQARQLVSRALAARMVRCAAEGWDRAHQVVVGDDPEVLALCARVGLATLADVGAGQSEAVRSGQRWCLDRGARILATVAADLPRVEGSDLRQLSGLADEMPPNSLVAFPDGSGTGTNGLLVNPADCDPFSFGPDSLRRHQEMARRLGLSFSVLTLPHLAWDVDRASDLEPPDPLLAEGSHPVLAWAKEAAALERLSLYPKARADGG